MHLVIVKPVRLPNLTVIRPADRKSPSPALDRYVVDQPPPPRGSLLELVV